MSDFKGTDRYSVVRQIGQGGMGSVYEARDTLLDTTVALKTLHRGTSPEVLFFKREFRSIADLSHPNLVRLFDLKLEGERWFFTMELIEGVPLTSHLAAASGEAGGGALPQTPCDLEGLGELLAQVLDALEVLHHHGVVHRDIKPDNILVTPSGRVKVVDFGIAQPVSEPSLHDRIMGTATYMSPEQTRSGPVTPASDLYSLGVVLFELLAGRRPFQGAHFELLAAHRMQAPPRIDALVSGVPEALVEACGALLAKDPAARPTIEGLRRNLGLRRGSGGLMQLGPGAVFVGRREELALLRGRLALARRRQLQIALLEGESGSGKTTLARASARAAEAMGFTTFQGRCYEREDVPYPAFDRLMDRIAVHMSGWPCETLEAWRDALSDAARLFPVFRVPMQQIDAPWAIAPAEGDPVSWRRRGLHGLASVITALCLRAPVLFVLDDLQWAATEDLQLLGGLLRLCERCPLMIVATCRVGALGEAHPLNTLREGLRGDPKLLEVPMGPLREDEVAVLLGGVFKEARDSSAMASFVMEQTGGNPFFVGQMTWMLHSEATPQSLARKDPTLPDLEGLVRWRLMQLPDEASELVELASVAGGPVTHEMLQATSPLDPRAFNAAVDQLVSAHLFRATGDALARDELRYDLYHDRFREVAYQDLRPHRRQQLHGAWALALERQLALEGAPRAAVLESLHRHWTCAGQRSRAWRYGLQAAEEAAGCLAFERAARLYLALLTSDEGEHLATAGGGHHSPLEQARLWERMAMMLEYTGDYAGACWALAEAIDCLSDDQGEPPSVIPPGEPGDGELAACVRRLYLWLADDLLKTGQLSSGERIFERLLSPLGLKLRHQTFETTGLLASLRLRAVGSAVLAESRRRAPTAMDHFQLDLFRKIFESFALVRPHYMAEYLLRYQLLARRLDDPAAQAYDRAYEGIYVAMTSRSPGRFDRSRALFDESQGFFNQTTLPFAPAYTLGFRGLIHWLEGDWPAARDKLETALTFATEHQFTHLWEAFMVRAWLLRTCHYAGDHERAEALALVMLEEASDRDVVRFGQAAWVMACRMLQQGRFEGANALLDTWRPLVPQEPNHQRLLLEVAQMIADLDQGNIEGVPERALASGEELRQAGCLTSPWHEALCYLPALDAAAALEAQGRGIDKHHKAALLKAARAVQREAAPFMACMAHRAQAMLAQAEGDERGAQTHIHKALKLSAISQTPYHRYLCLDAATRLGVSDEALHEEMADLAIESGYRVRT